MSLEDTGMDGSVVVDEALLNAVRVQASRASSAPGAADDDLADEAIADPAARSIPADTTDSDGRVPTVEGYGALREIGRGGFSRVYEALQFEFERWVAVKVLNDVLEGPDAAEDFERECRAMGGLSGHPNIVTVFSSAFASDGRPCVVMELFPHGSYLDILLRAGPLGLDQLLPVSVRIAGALATAHNRGMVHGDVKPQNIFRSQYELAALGDFGISTLISQSWRTQKTRMSMYYAAPEIIERGSMVASPFSDQYSLGATVYTLATGHRPFEGRAGETTRELLVRTLSEDPPRLGPEFPPSLDEALHKAMARKLQDRHQDLVEFGTVLTGIEDEIGLAPTSMRVGSDAGRYTGGAIDLEFSQSRSLERSGDRSRSAERPSASTSDAGTRPTGESPAGAAPTGESPSGRDDAPPPEATVVRPGRATRAEAPAAGARRKGPRRRWALVVVASVMLLAAGAGALWWFGDLPWPPRDGEREPTTETVPPTSTEPAPETVPPTSTEPAPETVPPTSTEPPESIRPESIEVDPQSDGLVVTWDELPSAPDLWIDPIEGGLAVAWSAPEDEEWPVTRYYLEWEGPDGKITPEEYRASVTGAEIPGLVRGHTYVVRVAAENQNGRGGWSSETVTVPFTPPDPPREPAVQEHYRRLEVSWSEPADDGGSAVTGYRAELHAGGEVQHFRNVPPDSFTADFRGLDSGRSYGVRLFAENEAGRSNPIVALGSSLYRVAFVSDHEGVDAIYFADVSRTGDSFSAAEPERLSGIDQELIEGLPSWSPDGSWVAFQRLHPGGTYRQIWVKNIETGEEFQLVCGRASGWSPDWSPDGRSIAFARGDRGNDLWMIDVRTGEERSLKAVFDADDAYPSWSPDGDAIAFARRDHDPRRSSWYNSRSPREIRVLNSVVSETEAAERSVQRLTNYATGNYSAPDWSPEGDRIAYAVSVKGSSTRHIEVMDGDGLVQLTRDHMDAYPSWSPDGEWIAFARGADGARDLYVVSAAGGEPIPLVVNDQFDYWSPSWAPSSNASVWPAFDCRSQ